MKPTYVKVIAGEKARVRMADGRIVDSWHPSHPLKDGCVQISEAEWQAHADARALADVALPEAPDAPVSAPLEPVE